MSSASSAVSGAAYRGQARVRPYDPALRVRPCDACGAGLVVGDAAETRRCDGCGHEQDVPAATPIALVASAPGDEAARLVSLRAELDHDWLMPASIAKYGNVLEDELGEARAVWARARRRIEDGDDSREARVELLILSFSLHSGMPARTDPERLARRALIEAAAETLRDPAMRQKLLGNMVIGALRAGASDDAKAWLDRFDPRSPSLDADSMYRLGAALLSTDRGDYARVLELVGRASGRIPIHKSSQSMVATVRANALEKLGSVEDAVSVLYEQIKAKHSALALMKSVVENMPEDWALCERSLPLAIRRDYERLANEIRLPAGRVVSVLALLGSLALGGGLAAGNLVLWPGVAAGALLFFAAYWVWRGLSRDRMAIIEGCQPVTGRILELRVGAAGMCDLDVVVEREGVEDVRTTTRQFINKRILAMKLEGASFDALWNPAHPEIFPRITINVAGDG